MRSEVCGVLYGVCAVWGVHCALCAVGCGVADSAVQTVRTPCTDHVHTMYTPPGLITYYLLPTYLLRWSPSSGWTCTTIAWAGTYQPRSPTYRYVAKCVSTYLLWQHLALLTYYGSTSP